MAKEIIHIAKPLSAEEIRRVLKIPMSTVKEAQRVVELISRKTSPDSKKTSSGKKTI